MSKPAPHLVTRGVVRSETDAGGKLLDKAFSFLGSPIPCDAAQELEFTQRRGAVGYYRLMTIRRGAD